MDSQAAYIDWILRNLKDGKTKGGLAKALGVHPSQITRLLSHDRAIKAQELSIITKYLGVAPPSDAPPIPEQEAIPSDQPPSHEEARALPEYDIRAGASYGGGISDEEWVVDGETSDPVVAHWIFPPAYIEKELGLFYGFADVLPVRGDSMDDGSAYSLKSGDRVIIDRKDVDPRQGGIFAVHDGDGVIVKQVELVRERGVAKVVCKSLNPRYDPIYLTLEDGVHIIGRVAGKISRM